MIGEDFKSTYYSMEAQKKDIFFSVSAVMFCRQYLAYAEHIDMSAFLFNPRTFK